MKWRNWTGLEPETEEDRRRMRLANVGLLSAMGRATVVCLLLWTLAVSLTEEMVDALARELVIGSYSVNFLLLDPLVLVAFAWAFAPAGRALYRYWELLGEAKRDPNVATWESEDWDAEGGEN